MFSDPSGGCPYPVPPLPDPAPDVCLASYAREPAPHLPDSGKKRSRLVDSTGGSKPRKKLWKCVYPGCDERLKTHYNCHSHVWDAHVRHDLPHAVAEAGLVYKKLPNRDAVKYLCERYMVELSDEHCSRERKRHHRSQPPVLLLGAATTDSNGEPVFVGQDDQNVANGNNASLNLVPVYAQSQNLVFGSSSKNDEVEGLAATSNGSSADSSPLLTFSPSSTDESPSTTSDGSPSTNLSELWSLLVSSQDDPLNQTPEFANLSNMPSSGDEDTRFVLEDENAQNNTVAGSPSSYNGDTESFSSTSPVSESVCDSEALVNCVPLERVGVEVKLYNPDYVISAEDFMRIVEVSANLRRLHVCGEVFAEKGFLQRSDERFKHDIQPITGALQRVTQVVGRSYRYKGDSTQKIGFIAQELENVIPEAVRRDDEGLSVDVNALIPMIIEALKEVYETTQKLQGGNGQGDDGFSLLKSAVGEALKRVAALEGGLRKLHYATEDDSLKKSKSNGFQYDLIFGPPFLVVLFAVAFAGAGIIAPFLIKQMPFVWGYCYFVAFILSLSLICRQRKEVIQMVKYREIKLFWTPACSINLCGLLLLALTGLALSTIMGILVVEVVAIFLAGLLISWGFAIVARAKYNISMRTPIIFLASALFIGMIGYAVFFMVQPWTCHFRGYESTHLINVQVRVGVPITSLEMVEIPWNCPFYDVRTSKNFPSNISVSMDDGVPPYISGTANELFPTIRSEVYLICLDYLRFYCSTVTFQVSFDDFLPACQQLVSQSDCLDNDCGWCEDASMPEAGFCGPCDEDFASTCSGPTQLVTCGLQTPTSTSVATLWHFSGRLGILLLLCVLSVVAV